MLLANAHNQVHDYRDVHDQHDDFDRCQMLAQLIHLKRNQASRRDDCEVFHPSLSERQARSSGHEEASVYERSDV